MTRNSYPELAMAVLDGDASPEERARLQALLDADAALKAQFGGLQSAQRVLSQVAPVEPPQGLADAVIVKILSRREDSVTLRQLFQTSSVVGSRAGTKSPGAAKAASPLGYFVQFLQSMKEKMMSDPKPGIFSGTKFKVLAGGGIALAALVVVSTGVDFSGAEKNTSGTIAPAERYRSTTAPTAIVTTPGTTQPTTATAIGGEGIGASKIGGDKIGGDKLGGDKLGGDKLGGDKLGGDKLGGDKLGGDKLGGDKIGGDKIGGDKIGGDKLGGDKLGGDKLGGGKIGGDKLGGDKIGGDKLGGDKLGGGKIGGDKLGGDKLGGDKLGGGKVGGDKLGGDKLGGDKLGGDKTATKP
ncbi:MAG TPA: hypothetical protein VK996_15130 [Ramlibacter sp.]|nr:hypothetical protein [Ramlibacter sp.]